MKKKLFRLMILNTELRKTDKFVIAYNEGRLSKEEYAAIEEKRAALLNQASNLEKEIKNGKNY